MRNWFIFKSAPLPGEYVLPLAICLPPLRSQSIPLFFFKLCAVTVSRACGKQQRYLVLISARHGYCWIVTFIGYGNTLVTVRSVFFPKLSYFSEYVRSPETVGGESRGWGSWRTEKAARAAGSSGNRYNYKCLCTYWWWCRSVLTQPFLDGLQTLHQNTVLTQREVGQAKPLYTDKPPTAAIYRLCTYIFKAPVTKTTVCSLTCFPPASLSPPGNSSILPI